MGAVDTSESVAPEARRSAWPRRNGGWFVPLEVFDSDDHPVLFSDSEGKVRFFNRAAARLWDCRRRDALGRPCWEVTGFSTRAGRRFCSESCPVQRRARAGRSIPTHRVMLRSNGDPAPFDLFAFAIPADGTSRLPVLHLLRPAAGTRRGGRDALGSAFRRGPALEVLTGREVQVLELFAGGLGTRGVAERLCISPATVRNHSQSILRKLEVHRRLDAVLTLLSRRNPQ